MKFEWDQKKALSNLRKHKVSFEEASRALSDPMAATGADPDHSTGEFRYITFGVSERGRLLVVAHTERGETIRIISARIAGKGSERFMKKVKQTKKTNCVRSINVQTSQSLWCVASMQSPA